MYGVKPWQGVRNQDIILRIEKGERLRRPDCCPKSLYEFLITMWSIEPYDRPTMLDTKQFMEHLLKQIDCNIPYNKLEASHEYLNVFFLIFYFYFIQLLVKKNKKNVKGIK